MICDGCESEYHSYCLEVPLEEVPEGAFYCPKCEAQGKRPEGVSGPGASSTDEESVNDEAQEPSLVVEGMAATPQTPFRGCYSFLTRRAAGAIVALTAEDGAMLDLKTKSLEEVLALEGADAETAAGRFWSVNPRWRSARECLAGQARQT